MNFKHIIEVLKSASRGRVKNPLGRWNLDNHTQTKLKINYANEDHCGSCAEYIYQIYNVIINIFIILIITFG